jgi:hypothetical protein
VAAFAEPVSTRWEIPAQVFPPESFGPCAIAGDKFTAVSKARLAPASNRVFISVLRDDSADSGIAVASRVARFHRRHASRKFRKAALDAKT